MQRSLYFHNIQYLDLSYYLFRLGTNTEEKEGNISLNDHLDLLRRGDVFKKYSKMWSAHRRYVWYEEKEDAIKWRPLGNKKKGTEKGITIREICDVRTDQTGKSGSGKNNKVIRILFEIYLKIHYIIFVLFLDLHFSIVSKNRALDLETESKLTRDNWVAAIQALRQSKALL